MIRVVGIDPSIASTGIARADIEPADELTEDGRGVVRAAGVVRGSWTGAFGVPGKPTPTVRERWSRLDAVADLVEAEASDPDLFVIEGPAPGLAANRGGHDLAGAWWLIVDRILAQRRLASTDFLVIAPPKLKLYVAGSGGRDTDKPAMVGAVRRHYGPSFDLPLDKSVEDVSDAIGLVAIGARFLGVPIDLDHPHRTEAMRGVRIRPERKTPKTTAGARRRRTPERTS